MEARYSTESESAEPTPESLPKRTRESTRDLMLRAGMQLATERASAVDQTWLPIALAHIRVTEVVQAATLLAGEEAGVEHPAPITTGAIYQIWPSQAEYQTDLLFHIIREAVSQTPEWLFKEGLLLLSQGLEAAAVHCKLENMTFKRYREDPLTYLYYCFYSIASIAQVREALGESLRTYDANRFSAHEALIRAAGRRLKPGITIADYQATITALVEGFTLRWRIDPAAVREGENWQGSEEMEVTGSLVGFVAKVIFEGFTEPIHQEFGV